MINKRALLALGMLPALALGQPRNDVPECVDRIEIRVAPELTGHVDRILPCNYLIRFKLDERGEADLISAQVDESGCGAFGDEVLKAFAQYTFTPGKLVEDCRIWIRLRRSPE